MIMMYETIINKIYKISSNYVDLQYILGSAFLKKSNVDYSRDTYLKEKFDKLDLTQVSKIEKILPKTFTIEELIKLYEILVPKTERQINGVYFTPAFIKNYISLRALDKFEFIPQVCDPSCGCGSFLYTVAIEMHHKYKISYKEVFEKYIYGCDIIQNNIEKAKIVFKMLGLINGEIISNFNLISCNSLSSNFKFGKKKKFDIVIGNPPYVRAKNINEESKNYLNAWHTSTSGNPDLYIPFYELGLSILKDNGVLGYISPNTFLISSNGKLLRNYLLDNSNNIEIIDFKSYKVFKKIMTYTCIVLVNANSNNKVLKYTTNKNDILSSLEFNDYNYYDLYNNTWRIVKKKDNEVINKLEQFEFKLENLIIRNGIATLKNDLYIFTPIKEDEKYYYRVYNNKKYKIEKEICRDIVKPNILKNEKDLIVKNEKVIFPYKSINKKFVVIDENDMIFKYPKTYDFFCDNKNVLLERDKGNKKYPAWYAFGRTQGLNCFGKKMFIPYLSDKCYSVITNNENLLFYCGYSIMENDFIELKLLKKILESKLFDFYIKKVSKPYSGGFYSYAKNYINKFSLPKLTNEQKEYLLKEKKSKNINEFLCEIYGIDIDLIDEK